MKHFSSTELANNTGDVLAAAAQSAVEINRHGKPRFVLLSIERFQELLNHGAREAVHVSDLSDSDAASLIGDLQDSIDND
jgi:prevent-host-death family protein